MYKFNSVWEIQFRCKKSSFSLLITSFLISFTWYLHTFNLSHLWLSFGTILKVQLYSSICSHEIMFDFKIYLISWFFYSLFNFSPIVPSIGVSFQVAFELKICLWWIKILMWISQARTTCLQSKVLVQCSFL